MESTLITKNKAKRPENKPPRQSESFRKIKHLLKQRKAKEYIDANGQTFSKNLNLEPKGNLIRWVLLHFATKYKADWNKIYKSLESREQIPIDDLKDTIEIYKDINWLSPVDSKYPKQLKKGHMPPYVLFYEGNLDLLKKKTVQASMSKFDQEDLLNVKNNFKGLTKDISLVTDLSTKEDEIFLKANQQFKRGTIIVSSKAIGPKFEQTKNDLLLSECPPGTTQAKSSTDRLTASVSDSLVLFNSSEKIHKNLVNEYLKLEKPLYCFSKKAENYNKKIIELGAKEITSYKKVIKPLAISERRR